MVASHLIDQITVISILVLLILPEFFHFVSMIILSALQDVRRFGLLFLHLLSQLLHLLVMTALLARHLLVMSPLHILHVVPELSYLLIMSVLCVLFVFVHLADLCLMLGLHVSLLQNIFLLSTRFFVVQLSQLGLMLAVSLAERCSCLFLQGSDMIEVLLFFLCQCLVVCLFITLHLGVLVCLLLEMLLICLLQLLEVLLLLIRNLLFQVLNLISQAIDFFQGLVVLHFVCLCVDGNLLTRLDDVCLEDTSVTLGGLEVGLVIFNFLVDVGKAGQLVIECDKRGLHSLNLSVPLT